MKRLIRKLWHDDAGAIISTELTMVMGIIVSGLASGMVALRNNVNRGLAAVAEPSLASIPTTADIQRQIAVQPAPWVAKSQSQSTANANASSNVSVYVNVQYPTRNDLPSP